VIRAAHPDITPPHRALCLALARAALFAALMVAIRPQDAAAGTHATCDIAAAEAAAETGVPLSILRALARTESGRTRDGVFAPWPWTVNNAGDGRWFPGLTSAQDHVSRLRAAGETNIDIGCFQINLRWHGHAFDSVSDMFDPTQNARYAARFLTGLHREFGTWDEAVAAFHSRTPQLASRYMARFRRVHADLGGDAIGAPVRSRPTPERQADAPPAAARALDLDRRPPLLASGAITARPGFLSRAPARPLWGDRP
jgi:hypothetical protein